MWLPGWRYSAELIAERAERHRRIGLEEASCTMVGIGKRGLSPHPLQRSMVERYWLWPIVGSVWLAGFCWVFVLQAQGFVRTAQYFVALVLLVFARYWMSPRRRMSAADRWNEEVPLYPWASWLPWQASPSTDTGEDS